MELRTQWSVKFALRLNAELEIIEQLKQEADIVNITNCAPRKILNKRILLLSSVEDKICNTWLLIQLKGSHTSTLHF